MTDYSLASRARYDPAFNQLSVRTRNCLFRARIFTLTDLAAQSDEDLLRNRNFGVGCLHEVHELLARDSDFDFVIGAADDFFIGSDEEPGGAVTPLSERLAIAIAIVTREVDAGRLSEAVTIPFVTTQGLPISVGALLTELNLEMPASASDHSARALSRLAEALDRKTVDDDVADLFGPLGPREAGILRRRLHPEEMETLQAIANSLGVTPERVRQIQGVAARRVSRATARTLAVRAATAIWEILGSYRFRDLAAIESTLRERGLIVEHQAFVDLLIVWKLTDLQADFPSRFAEALHEARRARDSIRRSSAVASQ